MLLWKCKVCNSKRSKFIKGQAVCELLSKSETPFTKISLLVDVLF